MEGKIRSIKNDYISHVEKELAKSGIERMSDEQADIIKDLSEAEKACAEAEYYRTITMQMGQSGYPVMRQYGYPDGYSEPDMQMGYRRYGWQNQYGSGRNGYDPMGHGDAVEGVRNIMTWATPAEKERIRKMAQEA